MPMAGLAAPTNCWPYWLQTYADALAASATFRALVGLGVGAPTAEVQQRIFGKRLTHDLTGRVWTRAELDALSAYAMILPDGYGKHRAASKSLHPHGAAAVGLFRLVPEAELADNGDGSQPTDADDRKWQNAVGTIMDEMLAWLDERVGPIVTADVTFDGETPGQSQTQQGTWLETEITFSHRVD